MIALGVAPGLSSLSYAVLEQHDGHRHPVLLDADVLHGGKGLTAAQSWDILKRSRVHHLMLDVICDRYVPAVVATGPPLNLDEPPEHVVAVRLLVGALARGLGVTVVELGAYPELFRLLRTSARGLAGTVREEVPNFGAVRDKRLVLATGIALAGLARSGST